MMILLLRVMFGSIVVSAGFMLGTMGRLAAKEARRIGFVPALSSLYVWTSGSMFLFSAGQIVICGLRAIDSFHGHQVLSSWNVLLLIGFIMLAIAFIGFNWAGTVILERYGRTIWWSFICTLALWIAFAVTWTWGHEGV